MRKNRTQSSITAQLLERLHHPLQLRAFVTATVFLVGYAAVYLPLDSQIVETSRQLSKEKLRLQLARDIEQLRAQQKRFQQRVSQQRDQNEWVEYLLGAIRPLPLKLVTLEAKTPQEIGPFKVVVLNCDLEGAFHDMEQLLRWIEYNDRLFRIDSVKISPHRSNNGTLVMQLVILGVMG